MHCSTPQERGEIKVTEGILLHTEKIYLYGMFSITHDGVISNSGAFLKTIRSYPKYPANI